jgi:hypothetical protein
MTRVGQPRILLVTSGNPGLPLPTDGGGRQRTNLIHGALRAVGRVETLVLDRPCWRYVRRLENENGAASVALDRYTGDAPSHAETSSIARLATWLHAVGFTVLQLWRHPIVALRGLLWSDEGDLCVLCVERHVGSQQALLRRHNLYLAAADAG